MTSTLFAPTADPNERAPARPTRRVMHLINGEHYSGAERVQDLLALGLPAEGFEVGFACVKPNQFPRMRVAQDAPLYTLPMQGRFDLSAALKLARIVRREGYDLIHAHTPRTSLIGRIAAWRAGVPLVYHVHSPAGRDSTRPWQDRVNALAERLALWGRVPLVAVSASLGQYMSEHGFAAERIRVVPNGVPRADLLRDATPPRDTWTLGTVALFRPRKGIEVLLDAMAQLVEAGLPVELRAVGRFESDAYEAEVKGRAARLGLTRMIRWTGFTSDVGAELVQTDLLVLPSLFGEGLPMVVLEAMAAGVPVVGTRVEGVPEAIRHGVDGLLAEPGDAASLAVALGDVIEGRADWSALRTSALARHAELFSDTAMAGGLAAVYRQVLGEADQRA